MNTFRAARKALLAPSVFISFICCAMLVSGATRTLAADSASFSDGFEGASLDPFWTASQQNGSVVFPYTGQVHSGTNAVLLQASGGGQKEMSLSHTFDKSQYGTVSVWVYDTEEYIYWSMGVQNVATETCGNGIAVQDWDTSGYYFGVSDCVSGGKSAVPRSVGWHKLKVESTATALVLSVDDQVVYSGTGGKPFDHVVLRMSGPGYSGNIAFDDFSFEPDTRFSPPTDFTCITNNGAITVAGYTGPGGDVSIPDNIGGLPVTAIDQSAFYNRSTLTNLTIPDSITNIANWAFAYCSGLGNVTIGKGLAAIGYKAFASCPRLAAFSVDAQNVAFSSLDGVLFNKDKSALLMCPMQKSGSYAVPGTVTCIKSGAFDHCTGINGVTISDSVTNIESGAFYSCRGLANLSIGNSVRTIGNVAFYYCVGLTNVTIPDSVTSIHGAFSDCENLVQVTLGNSLTDIGGAFVRCYKLSCATIPNTVTTIGEMAFAGCSSLTNVSIPNTVTNIEGGAFSDCSRLPGISLPPNVSSIGDYAFDYCSGLPSVVIPPAVTRVGKFAFRYCSGLSAVALPDSVTSVGEGVFNNCGWLTNIVVGKGLASIETGAFSGTRRLTAITVDPLNTSFSSIDGVLFNKNATTLIFFPMGKSGSYTIPDGVNEIVSFAFNGCSALTQITLPGSVTNIGWAVFDGCSGLSRMMFRGNAPVFGGSGFQNVTSATVYYLPGTLGWDSIYGGRPAVLWNPQISTGNANFGIQTNSFGFSITGSQDIPVVVEACADLASDAWVPLQTNIVSGGSVYFNDPQWESFPGRYYRLRWP